VTDESTHRAAGRVRDQHGGKHPRPARPPGSAKTHRCERTNTAASIPGVGLGPPRISSLGFGSTGEHIKEALDVIKKRFQPATGVESQVEYVNA
jgi:hypothetical protein